MTASVTFQEIRTTRVRPGSDTRLTPESPESLAAPIVLIPKRTVTDLSGTSIVWVVTGGTATRRQVVLGRERLDQVEVRSGVAPGEALVLNPPPTLTDRGLVRLKGK